MTWKPFYEDDRGLERKWKNPLKKLRERQTKKLEDLNKSLSKMLRKSRKQTNKQMVGGNYSRPENGIRNKKK